MSVRGSIGQASQIGVKANHLLRAPERSGRVLAVVSNATYLQLDDGEIVWLAAEDGKAQAHTRSVLGTIELSALHTDLQVTSSGAALLFDGHLSLDLSHATIWTAPVIQPERVRRPEATAANYLKLLTAVQALDCGESLGQAMPVIAATASGAKDVSISSSNPFIAAAINAVTNIARACRDQDVPRILQAGSTLVGLGQGLTPAGDDFLGGLLFVAYHLRAAYPDVPRFLALPDAEWIQNARQRTNAISFAILSDHVQGQSVESLHDLVAALLTGDESGSAMRHVHRLLQIGNTSGWDMLTGVMTGMLLVGGASS